MQVQNQQQERQEPQIQSLQVIQNNDTNLQVFKPSFKVQLLVGYLFFIQGMFFQVDLVYRMKLNTFIFMPMVFVIIIKILICPLVEKFTFFKYGKRKTWIIISLFALGLSELLFHSNQIYSTFTIHFFIVFFAFLFYTIALQPFALKEIRLPSKTAEIQIIFFTLGAFFDLIVVSLTKYGQITQFSRKFILIPLITGAMLFIHFSHKESELGSQNRMKQKSLTQIFKYFQVFINPISRYSRLIFFLMIYNVGFSIFKQVEVELLIQDVIISTAVFQQQEYKSITLILVFIAFLIIISFTVHKIAAKIKQNTVLKFLIAIQIAKLIIYSLTSILYANLVQPFQPSGLFRLFSFLICYTILALFTLNSFVISLIIFQLPISGTGGMFLGILFSVAHLRHVFNFESIIQQQVMVKYRVLATIVGLVVQAVVICLLPRIYKFMKEGSVRFDSENQQKTFVQNLILQQFTLSQSTHHQIQQGN